MVSLQLKKCVVMWTSREDKVSPQKVNFCDNANIITLDTQAVFDAQYVHIIWAYSILSNHSLFCSTLHTISGRKNIFTLFTQQAQYRREYQKDVEYKLHHGLTKLVWSVFLNLKPISYDFGIYMAWFFIQNLLEFVRLDIPLDHDLMASI